MTTLNFINYKSFESARSSRPLFDLWQRPRLLLPYTKYSFQAHEGKKWEKITNKKPLASLLFLPLAKFQCFSWSSTYRHRRFCLSAKWLDVSVGVGPIQDGARDSESLINFSLSKWPARQARAGSARPPSHQRLSRRPINRCPSFDSMNNVFITGSTINLSAFTKPANYH